MTMDWSEKNERLPEDPYAIGLALIT